MRAQLIREARKIIYARFSNYTATTLQPHTI